MIIYQNKNGYRYNSDSLILYDFIKDDNLKGLGLDIGSGSGVLSVLLSENKKIKMHAIDIQEENVKLTEYNFLKNNLDYKVFTGDFLNFSNISEYDFLVSNPPFYSKMKAQNKHLSISRHADFLPLEDFLKKSYSILKPKGCLYFCYDAKKIDEIFQFLINTKLKCTKLRFVHTKEDKPANLVLLRLKKISKDDIKILPPLISYKDNKESEELKNIYKNIKVYSCDL